MNEYYPGEGQSGEWEGRAGSAGQVGRDQTLKETKESGSNGNGELSRRVS
jgi:hypothetical protein